LNNINREIGVACVLLVVSIGALYGQFLWNPIIFDDMYFFMLDDMGTQPVSSYQFNLLELRSLPYATLAWTKAWFGLDLINFRLGGLLLHAAVVVVLYFFLIAMMKLADSRSRSQWVDKAMSTHWVAFFVALLFALNPVATYAAGYLIQRTTVMATLFSLLTMLAYVHGSVRQKTFSLWLTVPLYYLAVFSKEHAIMLLPVLMALTVLIHEDWQAKLKARWPVFMSLTLIAAFVVLTRKGLLGSVYEIDAASVLGNDGELAYPLSLLTQSWLFFKYVFLWIFPNSVWMSIDMREPFAPSVFSFYMLAVLGFLAWGIGAFWLLRQRGQRGLLGFAMLFPWLMFFTELASVRAQEVFVLYRSYLWAVGAFCALPVLLVKLNGRVASVVLVPIAMVMFLVSMERLMTLSQTVFIWDDAEKLVKHRPEVPGAYRIYYNRGTEWLNFGNADQAVKDFKQAIVLNKNFPEAHGNLGAAYLNKDDWQNAIDAFTLAIDLAKGSGKLLSPRYVHGRAQAYEKMGDIQKAQADYRVSCRLAKRGCEKIR
jgi:hypothetical protein